ncbi:hypothetical protein BOX17_11480 [Halomonas aestuarii]|uniref:Uncharacterized protein n=1 Tax=Halomonas aestuarii TaxID=1897729 RepID=A0A1J0VHL2_9GAMM|nr:hypothetical protein [Halomonas aestuarii]APE31512.1 hypothetical protein BOX17_11480 [Halomonas aestuarii]
MSPRPTHARPQPIGFAATCLRASLYILLVAGIAQGIYLEALYLPSSHFSEWGFTELAQTALLAASTLLLLYVRVVLRELPQVSLLLLALMTSSLVREQDALLDARVFDGAWQLLVALIILPILHGVIRRRRAFAAEFAGFANSFSFGLFAAGFLTTYVFSRLYGRSEMWQVILREDYVRTFKNAAEEVVELFGYALILIAMVELALLARHWHRAHG